MHELATADYFRDLAARLDAAPHGSTAALVAEVLRPDAVPEPHLHHCGIFLFHISAMREMWFRNLLCYAPLSRERQA